MKYKEIMDRVTVTDDMKGRILDSMEARIQLRHRRKKLYFMEALGAVAVVVIIFGIGSYMFRTPSLGNTSEQIETAIPDIEEVASAGEMSKILGFTVPDPVMPFDVKDKTYLVNWGELGEIDYEGENQSAYFRISKEEGDNSGDYNEYENVTTEKIDSITITLKGNQDKWNLAIWQDGEYSCSLGFSEGIAKDQILEVINGIL